MLDAKADVKMAHPGPCKDIGVQAVEQVANWMQLHSDQISADACTSLLEVVRSALQADTAQAEVQMAHPGPCTLESNLLSKLQNGVDAVA